MQQHRNYLKPNDTYTLAPAGAAVNQAVDPNVQIIRVLTSATGIALRTDGAVATAADMPLAANVPEYFICHPGATISVFGTGTVYVTEMM